jgi:hypothetical protein
MLAGVDVELIITIRNNATTRERRCHLKEKKRCLSRNWVIKDGNASKM